MDGSVVVEERTPTPKVRRTCATPSPRSSRRSLRTLAHRSARWCGAPGLVDRNGVLRAAPNLIGVAEMPIRDMLVERLGVPVTVDNDATCATEAEWRHGAATGASDALLITLGTGIGGGVVSGGVLQRGANGFMSEPGHMVVDPNGPPCVCGRRGCWERYASGSGLGHLAREAAIAGQLADVVALAGGDAEAVRSEHLIRAASEGNPGAIAVLDAFAWWVALGLVNLANLLDPALIVVGGGLIEAAELLLEPIRRLYEGLLYARRTGRGRTSCLRCSASAPVRWAPRSSRRTRSAGSADRPHPRAWISSTRFPASNWPVVDSLPGSMSL
jgi:glucokinase